MPLMMKRNLQPEWMDQPGLSDDEHIAALAGLARLNRYTGIAAAMYRHLRRDAIARSGRPLRVLDVASGGGDVPIEWARRAAKEGIAMQITAVDISSLAIAEQQRRAAEAGVSIRSIELDCIAGHLPLGYDLITCSLFMHHLTDLQVVRLLQSMQATAEDGILICDLDRSRLNLGLVSIGAHALSRSPIVHHDAKSSVRASFTADEFKRIAEGALNRPVRVRRVLPCRYMATLDARTCCESAVAFA